jgi:hypothetical protein
MPTPTPYQTTEPAQVLLYVNGAIADANRVVLPLTHQCGGSDPTSQANAPSLTFEWLGPLSFNYGGTPYPLTIGATIELTLDQAGGGTWSDVWDNLWSPALPVGTTPIPSITRFTGRITDLEAAADTVNLRTQVTAIGTSGEAASFQVGSAALPAQSETARVNALVAQAPYTVVVDAGTVGLVARDPNRTGLLDALQEVAESTGARVFEDGLGRIVYLGIEARKAETLAATLTAFDLIAPAEWAQHVAALINHLTVFYGPPPVGTAPQASVTAQDNPSQAAFGRQHADLSTAIATLDDAAIYAVAVLAHWSLPWWDAPQVSVRADVLDVDTWVDVMNAELGQILITQGITGVPSTPTGEGKWLIEGWVQTWDRDDSGRLVDDLQIAVSEYERWVADGRADSTTTAVAVPTTVAQLSSTTITATVRSNDAPVTSGRVEVRDGATLLGSGALGVGGTATIVVRPNVVGPRQLTVTFTGTAAVRDSNGSVAITVTPVTTTSVAFVMSPSSGVRNGDKVTLTATVSPVGVAGSIRWEYNRDGGGWSVLSGKDVAVSPTTGKASTSWDAGAGRSYLWRAVYVPTPGSTFTGSTSNVVTLTVAQQSSQTRTYSATDGATYQSDGDKRSDTNDLYQGYYSGTNGNQRAIATFASMAGDWSGATITKVEVWLETPHWNSAAGGTAVVGSYTSSSLPGSWPGSGLNADRSRVSFDRGQGKWFTISWGNGFATGALRSLVLGPGPSTSAEYYGYATGTGADRPKIRITGNVWS